MDGYLVLVGMSVFEGDKVMVGESDGVIVISSVAVSVGGGVDDSVGEWFSSDVSDIAAVGLLGGVGE
jgi:hypothetical protein